MGRGRKLVDSRAVLVALVLGSVLLLGGVPSWSILVLTPVALVGLWQKGTRPPTVVGVMVLLGAYSAFQACPLPQPLANLLSPSGAQLWAAIGAQPRLSIEPAASMVEAMRWLLYGCTVTVASHCARFGTAFALRPIFWSIFLVVLVGVIHGILGETRVFGVYEPSFGQTRWAVSPLLNPNNQAGLFNLGLFIGIYLFHKADGERERWAFVTASSLVASAVLMSQSRAGVLLAALGGVACYVFRLSGGSVGREGPKRGRPVLLAIPILAVSWALVVEGWSFWDGFFGGGSEKLEVFRAVPSLIRDYPWTGVGAGAFPTGFQPYQPIGSSKLWEHPENLVLGWLCDWGVPVGVLGALALFFYFRPTALGLHRRRSARMAYLGVLVVVLQNLADVGAAVPGVMVPTLATLGALSRSKRSRQAAKGRTRTQLAVRLGVTLGLLAGLAGYPWYGGHSLHDDRRVAEAGLTEQRSEGSAVVASKVFARIGKLRRYHPGDAYLARSAALVLHAAGNNKAIELAADALRLNPRSGKTHFVLALELYRRGALSQALLELRLAADYDSTLVETVAKTATGWTHDGIALRQVVPSGRSGARMLLLLAHYMPRDSSLVASFLEDAVARDRGSSQIRYRRVERLLSDIDEERPPCDKRRRSECLSLASSEMDALSALIEKAPTAYRARREPLRLLPLRARYAFLDGEPQLALRLLEEGCSGDSRSCLETWFELGLKIQANVEPAAKLLVAHQCRAQDSCSQILRRVGAAYIGSGDTLTGLEYMARECRETLEPACFMRVAGEAERTENFEIALRNYRRVLVLQPGQGAARTAVQRLETGVHKH